MRERKNIDSLFQEKFNGFEVTPPEAAWATIETKLEEKKKRRVIPFGWQFTGVAAILLLGFLLGKSVTNPSIKMASPEVNSSKVLSPEQKDLEKNAGQEINKIKPVSAEKAVAKQDLSKQSPSTTALPEKENKGTPNLHKTEKGLASAATTYQTNTKNKVHGTQYQANENKTIIGKPAAAIAENNHRELNTLAEKVKENTSPSPDQKALNLDVLKGDAGVNTKIVTQEMKVNDTTKTASVATNALEELLNEKESKTKGSKENRWQITSNAAPVFLGSLSNGSPIDPMFKDNTKRYNTNISLGLGVTYALNSKLSVRTGLNKMSYDYDTNDIIFFADLDNPGMTNISPSSTGKAIRVENKAAENVGLLPFENAFVHKNEGYINQRIGYLEMPLELTYALINKRFGLKVISGVSTFFLNENKVSVVSGSMSTDLGRANNLNDVHFSTNLGLGIKYGFWKSFEVHVEPTFKYQINTFSSNAGNFKPYLLGVYSGISYQF